VTFATRALLFLAALAGGALNAVAGGGSFVAFPALLFAGVPPVPANATNTIGLWPASLASAVAYRHELREVRRELPPLGGAALVGGFAGSLLLLHTPDRTFVLLIPFLLLFATLIFTFGPTVAGRLASGARVPLPLAVAAQVAISIYGGYFGGGMGIMMLSVLTLLGMQNIHRMNAIKNLLAVLINGAAVVTFVVAGTVRWSAGIGMVLGGLMGGYGAASVARRLEPAHVRAVVLFVAWAMTAYFFAKTYILPAG
jgi:uncharacterized membrane protein YfcA